MKYTFWVTKVKVINKDGRSGLLSEVVRYFKHQSSAEESLKQQSIFAEDLGLPKNNVKFELESLVIDTEDEKGPSLRGFGVLEEVKE
jgi:hypothetical protein